MRLVCVAVNASIDKIAAAAKSPLWFQLYPQKDMDVTKAWIDAAQQHIRNIRSIFREPFRTDGRQRDRQRRTKR